MKKLSYIIIVLMAVLMVNCQPSKTNEEVANPANDEKMVADAVKELYNAIVDANRAQLDALTDEGLVYGHSSGKVQDKTEFIAEIMDPEAFDYLSADITNETTKIVGNNAIDRHIYAADYKDKDGNPGSLKIGIMMVWQKQGSIWKLIARQAYKL